eukprot:TRINITY_DN12953_c0_g1_i1.p1 TRINITY_DN12953_c0_g1~~TRINITY_DN12953_c0_g1_i1.p1  ORF type:complete len:286 (-),score=23.67 TRINITY_DN12953_c0_g1_i1:861-1625(-)
MKCFVCSQSRVVKQSRISNLQQGRRGGIVQAQQLSVQLNYKTNNKNAVKNPYKALKGCKVFRVSDGQEVELVSEWNEQDTVWLVFGRSFGCNFCWELGMQLARDYLPELTKQKIKLLFVSVGTLETGKDFSKNTNFPEDRLYADPLNVTYDALGLYKGLPRTFFNIQTPISIAKRFLRDGAKDMLKVFDNWIPYQTPKPGQFTQQGGMYIFDGHECIYGHYDEATAASPDLNEVFKLIKITNEKADKCATQSQQ